MSSARRRGHFGFACAAATVLLAFGMAVQAQQPAGAEGVGARTGAPTGAAAAGRPGEAAASGGAAAGTLESDPIRCWLKTTKTAVHIGEQFNLALTCAVVDTSRIAVVPDLSQVEPTTLQVAPFEVITGTRHPDIRAGIWRYLQFEYTLRLIADSFFGQDLTIPAVSIKYAVQVSDAGLAQQGQEKSYVLPVIPVRIISLVPQNASDIRDASRDTFADIEARAFRGTVAFVAAAILLSLAALLLLVGIAKAFKQHRRQVVVRPPQLSPAAIAVGCLSTLQRTSSQAASQGWTPDLVGDALSTLRIAAALALKAPVTQLRVAPDAPAREGQLTLRRGILRPWKFIISTPMTSFLVARSAASTQESVKPFHDALKAFTETRYSRDREPDGTTLSALVDASCDALQALRWRLYWPFQVTNALIESAATRWRLVWAR
jgi:hypothetical protein